jgi:hypothetical protein
MAKTANLQEKFQGKSLLSLLNSYAEEHSECNFSMEMNILGSICSCLSFPSFCMSKK